MEETTIVKEEELKGEQSVVLARARELLAINSAEECNTATRYIMDIKAMEKKVDETFDDIIDKAHQAHKSIIAKRDEFRNPLVNARKLLDGGVKTFIAIEEKRRRDEDDKARAEAEKKAAAERDRLLKLAEKAQDKGNETKAEELVDRADAVVPAYVPPVAMPMKFAGTSVGEKYVGVLINRKAFIRAVADGRVSDELLEIKQTEVDKIGTATKGKVILPGIEWRRELKTSYRTAK